MVQNSCEIAHVCEPDGKGWTFRELRWRQEVVICIRYSLNDEFWGTKSTRPNFPVAWIRKFGNNLKG
jgi:hypothetical protein